MSDQETKRTGQSFIYSFYNETRVLIGNYANYINTLAEIGNLTDINKLENETKQIFINSVQQARASVSVTYIMVKSLEKHGIKIPKGFNQTYKNIKEEFVIKSKDLEEYVLAINTILASEIMSNLLQSNKEIINSLYGNE